MWYEQQVSLYSTHADNTGRAVSVRDVLMSEFARDMKTIIQIRELDKMDSNYKTKKVELKSKLQCFTPAALLESKQKGNLVVTSRTGLMQLDFDYQDICEYDMEELKQAVFALPFICFCGASCGGDGFYALALIAEPERLSEYAEHCFRVLNRHGVKPDESKGKKVENLRYVSYDSKMLIRENPEPLLIKHFYKKEEPKNIYSRTNRIYSGNEALVKFSLDKIRTAQTGQRWMTVQQVAFTLGGLGDKSLLYAIKSEIESNPEFQRQEHKYFKCAEDCFKAGTLRGKFVTTFIIYRSSNIISDFACGSVLRCFP